MSDNKELSEERVLDAHDKMKQEQYRELFSEHEKALEEYNNKARTARNDSQGE